MDFLITSGGTTIQVDGVRKINNMSTGRFGSGLALNALKKNHKVDFLSALGSIHPFQFSWDFYLNQDIESMNRMIGERIEIYQKHKDDFKMFNFKTFESYAFQLEERHLSKKHYDVVMLGAAVSDYTVPEDNKDKKISSDFDKLTIELVKTPKIINNIKRNFSNSYVVGFKLLFNASEQELISAMQKQLKSAGTDACIGNDLRDIMNGNHTVIILTKSGKEFRFDSQSGELAQKVIDVVEKLP